MYAKGMSQRDIADTIEDIYGFEISHDTISNITDQVIDTANEWQNRPLKKFYTFLFVDCLYVNIRKETETKSCAVYVVLGYDVNGIKISYASGLESLRVSTIGCRYLIKLNVVVLKIFCL